MNNEEIARSFIVFFSPLLENDRPAFRAFIKPNKKSIGFMDVLAKGINYLNIAGVPFYISQRDRLQQ